jgi:hypothetical protein
LTWQSTKKLEALDNYSSGVFVFKKIKILSDNPEKHYSSKYNKDNQDNHTYLGLAFMTYSGRGGMFRIDILFLAQVTGRDRFPIIVFF